MFPSTSIISYVNIARSHTSLQHYWPQIALSKSSTITMILQSSQWPAPAQPPASFLSGGLGFYRQSKLTHTTYYLKEKKQFLKLSTSRFESDYEATWHGLKLKKNIRISALWHSSSRTPLAMLLISRGVYSIIVWGSCIFKSAQILIVHIQFFYMRSQKNEYK